MMETVIDFLGQWQGEIVTGLGILGARYIPQGWNSVLRQSARFAGWYESMVFAILGENQSSKDSK